MKAHIARQQGDETRIRETRRPRSSSEAKPASPLTHDRDDLAVPDWYRLAILNEADAICRDTVRSNAAQYDQLRLLGLMAMRNGRFEFAVACLSRAVAIRRAEQHHHVALYYDYFALGDALIRIGRRTEALGAYLTSLTSAPNSPDIFGKLAHVLFLQGQLAVSAAMHEFSCTLCSEGTEKRASIQRELGSVRVAQGRLDVAVACYTRCLEVTPDDLEAISGLGHAQSALGQWQAAAASFRRGLGINNERADLHAGLAQSLFRLGTLGSAIDACHTALGLDHKNLSASQTLVLATEQSGQAADAICAWETFARALTAHDRHEQAALAWQQVLSRNPQSARALLSLGHVHLAQGHAREAMAMFDAALAIRPDDANAHIAVGWACHTLGDAARGWAELRWYLGPSGRRSRGYDQPVWDGSPLEGRTILLWSEPQLGDSIHFMRYISLAVAAGGRVVVECDRRLAALMARTPGVVRVVARGAPLPHFDVHAPLMLIPAILNTIDQMTSSIPYATVPAASLERWRAHLAHDGRLTVGLSWAGKPTSVTAHLRFLSLQMLAPLARIPDVRFVSLQTGPWTAELLVPPTGLHVESLQDGTCTLEDTASLIANLDLIISVDTMVAHLAGALGRPVWTLLPFQPDWRWPRNGDRTGWYPTMRLFRQPRQKDWQGAIERVRDALREARITAPSSP